MFLLPAAGYQLPATSFDLSSIESLFIRKCYNFIVTHTAGSRKPEAGSRKPVAGSRKPVAGSRKPEA
jgi:hypothetical protein